MQFQMKSGGSLLVSVQTGWSFPCSKGWCSTIILCDNELCHIPLPCTSCCGLYGYKGKGWHHPFFEFKLFLLWATFSWTFLRKPPAEVELESVRMGRLICAYAKSPDESFDIHPPFVFLLPLSFPLLVHNVCWTILLWGWETQTPLVQGKWWR